MMKTNIESFDDIVFKNRNKEYGAYELRKKYSKRATIALLISFAFFGFAVGGPLISSMMGKVIVVNFGPTDDGTRVLDKIPSDKPIVPPPPPPPIVDIKEIKFTTPIFVDTLSSEDIELNIADELKDGVNVGDVDTSTSFKDDFIEKKDDIDNTTVEIFNVDEKPFFPDGESALLRFVAENTKYPEKAIVQNIEGTVYIRFVVTKTGDVGDAKVMRSIDPLLENEAIRVIKSMPKWIPGKNNGLPVNVWFVIPVKFVLK